MKTRFFLLLTCLCVFGTLSAQDFYTITGEIYNQKTKTPIAYAHVGIPERGIGTTSGDDGKFVLRVPRQYASSTLVISYIGYKNYSKAIDKIPTPFRVYLEQSVNELMEVVVMGEDAIENIIRRAVKNIPKNYPTHGTTALGFYRESRTDSSLNYIYLAEGVLNIYKNTYKKKKEGMVSLIQGRKINLRDPLDTIVRSGFSSGHMAAHRFDFVKNREDFIEEKYFPVYKYWIESMTTYNDRPVYVIAFAKDEAGPDSAGEIEDESVRGSSGFSILGIGRKKKKSIKARMEGKIYIDQESYAFLRAEFFVTKEGLRKRSDYPLYSGSWRGNSYVVNYRQVGKKWYFSDALREGIYRNKGVYTNEIKITEINTEKTKPLPYLERMRPNREFARMTGYYDEHFWDNYNVTPLSAELAESVQQMKNTQKASEVFDKEYQARLRAQRDSIQRIEAKRIYAEINTEEEIDDEKLEQFILQQMSEPGLRRGRVRRQFNRFAMSLGLGTHVLKTGPQSLEMIYLTDDDSPETILTLHDSFPVRNFEVVANWDMDFFLRKNYFIRFGGSFDFYNSIYRDISLGLGAQYNLSKQRPVFFKMLAQVNSFKYARKVGQVKNEYGKFRFDDKKYKADRINLYYGSRTFNLKLSAEISVELDPSREFYIRGTYHLPFARRQEVWMWERRELFRKKRRTPASNDRLVITEDGLPFNDQIMPESSFSIAIGYLFK